MKIAPSLRPLLATAAALALLAAPSARAVDVTWNGTTGNGTWSSGNFIGGAPTNADRVVFSSVSGTQAITVNSTTLNVQGFLFNNTGTTLIGGNGTGQGTNTTLTIGSAGITVDAAAGAVTFGTTTSPGRVATTINGTQTWMNNGTLTFASTTGGAFGLGANTLTIDGSGTTSIAGIVSGTAGTGKITKNGTGTLTLNGANTFTGGLTLNDGKLNLGANAALGGAANVLTINGGTVDVTTARTTTNNNAQNWNGNFTFGGTNTWDTGTGAVTMNASRTVTVSGSIMAVGGNISGVGFGLTKEGTGILRLNGTASTYSGGTTVNAGILSISNTGALPGWNTNGSYSVASGATLAVQNTVSDADFSTIMGTTNFSAGSRIGFDTAAGDRTYNGILTDAVMGTKSLNKIGLNTLFLGGANTFTTGIYVEAGSLGGSGWGAGDVTFNGGGIDSAGSPSISNNLIFNAQVGSNALSNDVILSGTISGTGILSYNGFSNGSFALSGNNTGWSGGINLTGAQIRLGHVNAAGTGVITYAGNANTVMQSMSSSVDLSGGNGVANNIVNNNAGASWILDNNLKLSGIISGAGSVRLSSGSTGTLFLTANNTYTGFTNIQESTLEVTNLGNGGEARNIGAASNAAINLVIGGGNSSVTPGTLRYTGVGETTDRLFTIGSASTSYNTSAANGAAPVVTLGDTVTSKIDASGTGALIFNNTGELIVGNALNTVFELTGTNTGNNTIAAVIGNTQAHAPLVLANSTTTSQTNGGPNKQISVTDTTGIRVGDTVTGTGITGSVTVGAVLSSTRLAIVTGATLEQTANATLTFTQPDVSLNKTSLLKSGAGTWVLTANNTYTGNTTITGGGLVVSDDKNLGAAPGSATPDHLVLSDGALVTTGTMVLNANRGILLDGTQGGQINVNSGTTTYGGIIAGSKALQKAGAGILSLSSTNTYSGATVISAGTLLLDSSGTIANSSGVNLGTAGSPGILDLTAKSSFAFGVGQSVSGTGTINIGAGKVVTINGNLAPGNSPGIVSVTGDLTLAGNADMEIAGSGGVAGTDFDRTNVSGALVWGGTISIVSFGGFTLDQAGSYDLFDFNSQSGNLSGVSFGGIALSYVALTNSWEGGNIGNTFDYSFKLNTGVLDVVAVPEPAAWILAAFGLTTAVVFRRRRRD